MEELEINGEKVLINISAKPTKNELVDIKFLRKKDLLQKTPGPIYGFMCKRCGSEWDLHGTKTHEIYCIHYKI